MAERIRRTESFDSSTTYVNSLAGLDEQTPDVSELISHFSRNSESTLTDNLEIFNESIGNYNVLRELPVVSSFLQQGVYVFSSMKSAEIYSNKNLSSEELDLYHSQGLGVPLLQTTSSMLSIFNPTSPFMTINRYKNATEKYEVCKVYFKIVSNHVSCYTLILNLQGGPKAVILLNNGIHPSTDFVWENTKCRVVGVTGAVSTFGNCLIKVYAMNEKSKLLSDDLEVKLKSTLKRMKIKMSDTNELCEAIRKGDKSKVKALVDQSKPLINIPVGTFIDNGSVKLLGKIVKHGTMKIFDSSSTDMSENSMVLACILLTLREQEYRKNKGNNKPTFI